MNSITLTLTILIGAAATLLFAAGFFNIAIVFYLVALVVFFGLKMANAWERFVILRIGKFHGVKGPGLFFIIPIIDSITAVIDNRIQTAPFNAERALTKDTVPVNVDAVIFWYVHDPERAALRITNYREAVDRVAQTTLREIIGTSLLTQLLAERKESDERLKEEIASKTAEWGIFINSVEIRDVAIPDVLQDAMSREAQAEREKHARVILGSAEVEIAANFVKAADNYAGKPEALHLRAMNIIYETTKERGATILIPTGMIDSISTALSSGRGGQKTP